MMRKTAGIYIHIPFCVRKCAYCDFLSFPAGDDVQERYVECVVREIHDSAASLYDSGEKPSADTVFFGGGTPSILPAHAVGRILEAVDSKYGICRDAEITVECNPCTADFEKFREYRRLGINRLSMGIQSAVDEELKTLGRLHTFAEAADCFDMAVQAGFSNINVDLMSAVPGQTADSYRFTLERILAMGPQHISAYSLIVEEGTPFYEMYGSRPPVDEETDRAMYALTKEVLAERGYKRYEISNYARDGFVCRHNLKYWCGGDYVGFGPGAASKIKNVRYKNETVFSEYMEGILHGRDIRGVEEVLDPADEMSEFFILGLRMTEGVSLAEFRERFAADAMERYGGVIEKSVEEGLLTMDSGRLCFTDRGLDVSNYVLCRFM